jgi:hypothetical protein
MSCAGPGEWASFAIPAPGASSNGWISHVFLALYLPVRPMKQLCYVLLFGVVMYFAVQQALEMGDSREWPTTEGVITASHIDRSHRTSTEKGWRGDRYEYEVRVQYSYSVDGVGYTGNRLRIRPDEYRSEERAQRELAEYPVGQRVRVYYDPKAPERSLLKHI